MKTENQKRIADIRQQRKAGKGGKRIAAILSIDTIQHQRELSAAFLRSFN